jgi:hypothetical protein
MEFGEYTTLIDQFSVDNIDLVGILKTLIGCVYSRNKKIENQEINQTRVKQTLQGASVCGKILETPIFHFAEVNVKIKFTTASPLQLSLKAYSLPMKQVNHITCNVGDMNLYCELFMAIHLCEELKRFRTMTLLLPALFAKKIHRFSYFLC